MSQSRTTAETSELRRLSRQAYRLAQRFDAEGRPDAAARARRLGAEAAREARRKTDGR